MAASASSKELAIITPVLPESSDHLPDCAASIRALQCMTEDRIAWVVVVDGDGLFPKSGCQIPPLSCACPLAQGRLQLAIWGLAWRKLTGYSL